MTTKNTTDTQNEVIKTLKTGIAKKLSPKASGEIKYAIGLHNETNELQIRLLSNSSGGYHSKEWVPFPNIEKCFDNTFDSEKTFKSILLKPSFLNRGSSNNAGFLAAVLRAEGIISADDKNPFLHIMTGNFDVWKKRQLKPEKTKK